MKKLIDLSQTITNSMPVYPGDLEVELKETKNLTKDGYCSHSLKISMHTGTHLDLPAHMVADQKEIADIDLSLLSGNLDQLADYDAFRILIFPLKIKAEAALCRVAAEI